VLEAIALTVDAVQGEKSESVEKLAVDKDLIALAVKMSITAQKYASTDGSLSGDTEERYFAVQAGLNKKGKESWSEGYIGWWANEGDCTSKKSPEGSIKLTKISSAKQDGKIVRVKHKSGDSSAELGVVLPADEKAAEWAAVFKELLNLVRKRQEKK